MKTGRKNSGMFETIGDLSALFANCLILITKSVRSSEQVSLLRRSCQLFMENRLTAAATSAQAGELPRNLQDILSIRILDTSFPKDREYLWYLSKYRFGKKLHYVGELFVRGPQQGDWRSDVDHRGAQYGRKHRNPAVAALRSLVNELGLPFDLNLDSVNGEGVGWQPPYASDPEVLKAWSMRFHDISDDKCPAEGCVTLGESLRKVGRYHRNFPKVLRGAMFVPPSWTAPPRDIEECRSYDGSGRAMP